MSGPKCSEYTVRRNAERLRLAREAAWRRAQTYEDALRDISAGNDEFVQQARSTFDRRPAQGSSPDDIHRYSLALKERIRAIDAEIRRVNVANQLQAFSSSVKISALPSQSRPAAGARPTQSGRRKQSSKSNLTETIDRILRRVSSVPAELDDSELLDIAEAMLKNPSRSRMLETELRVRVQELNEKARELQNNKDEVDDLLLSLRGLVGDEIDALRVELESHLDGGKPVSEELKGRAADAGQRASKRMDAEYVASTLAAELGRLGYDVGEQFTTMLVRDGRPKIVQRDESEYGLSIGIDKAANAINMEMIRQGDPGARLTLEQREKDLAAEREYCDDCHYLFERLEENGITNKLIRKSAIGQHPVRVIADDRQRTKARSARSLESRSLDSDR